MGRDELIATFCFHPMCSAADRGAVSNGLAKIQLSGVQHSNRPNLVEANAMVLGTISGDQPKARTVLLKEVSENGFVFYSNYESDKGKEISQNQNVSLTFPWFPMERQVIVLGSATKVSNAESADYFATRPWSSQIGAWASNQSEVIDDRDSLQKNWDEIAAKYPEGESWGFIFQFLWVELFLVPH